MDNKEKVARLNALIQQYLFNKNEADSYSDLCSKENAAIKDMMAEMGVDTWEVDGVKITRSVSNRVTLDEQKVMDILLADLGPNTPFIQVKTYVNMDALEKSMYAGGIPVETVLKLNSAKVVGPDVVTLRISKPKSGKGGRGCK